MDGIFKIMLRPSGGMSHIEYNGVRLPACEITLEESICARTRLRLDFEGVMVDVGYTEVEGTVVDADPGYLRDLKELETAPRLIEAPRNALEQRDEDGIE